MSTKNSKPNNIGTSNTRATSQDRRTDGRRWKKPASGSVKINFDGSTKSGISSHDFIIWDNFGRVCDLGKFHCHSASTLLAEATGLREGIKAALQCGCPSIVIESDSLIILNAVRGV